MLKNLIIFLIAIKNKMSNDIQLGNFLKLVTDHPIIQNFFIIGKLKGT